MSLNTEKWDAIKKSNPNIRIKLMFRDDLEKLGIKL